MKYKSMMDYRLVFFSRSRSCERDRCRLEELLVIERSRSCDDFRRLCFLLEGLRDRPIVSKSKQMNIK